MASRSTLVPVEALLAHPDRIDVRTPAEFGEDHIPGADNRPVLDDAQRVRVGTLYAQDSFAARKLGAAMVARNIADAVETAFVGRGREWRPLIYCWRGGKRSGAMTHVLNEIGWKAVQLEGGYRAYRRRVVAELATLPAGLRFVVVCGLTGSGKSRLLAAIASLREPAAQVLDLEAIARHRGSLLGDLPAEPQPSQKWFESQLWERLLALDPQHPVYVEAESKRIGSVQVPEALMQRMRECRCIRVATPAPMRVALLKDEYRHFLADPDPLRERLGRLVELQGRARIGHWEELIAAGDWDALVGELLARHYDPTYERSMQRNYPHYVSAMVVTPTALSVDGFAALARQAIAAEARREPPPRAALHPV